MSNRTRSAYCINDMILKPYKRMARPFQDSAYYQAQNEYLKLHGASIKPRNYIRSAEIIFKDLDRLHDFIEPVDANLQAYSFRIMGQIFRTCNEIEANF